MKKIAFLIIILSGIQNTYGQNHVRHYMVNLPQANFTDLSFYPNYKVAVGLPLISACAFNSHLPFAFNDAISEIRDDTAYLSIGNFIKKLPNTPALSFQSDVPLFYIGTKMKDDYVVFYANTKVFTEVGFPHDLIRLAWEGNAPFEGSFADLSGLTFNAFAYNEWGIGMSRELDNESRYGFRIKLLQGIANVSTGKSDVRLYTDTTTYWLTAKANYVLNMAGPIDTNGFKLDSPFDLINMDNFGLAGDAGLYLKLNDKLAISGSFSDLGFIYWGRKPKNFTVTDAEYKFEGIKIDNLDLSGFNDTFFQKLLDSFTNIFIPKRTTNAYSTMLRTNIYASLIWEPNKFTNLGVSVFKKFGTYSYPYVFTGFVSKTWWKFLNTTATTSWSRTGGFEIGAGSWLKIGPLQWYLTSDNLLSYISPLGAKNFNLTFGFNMIFGKQKDTKRSDFQF